MDIKLLTAWMSTWRSYEHANLERNDKITKITQEGREFTTGFDGKFSYGNLNLSMNSGGNTMHSN